MESAEILFSRNIVLLRQLSGYSLTKMSKMTGISFKKLKAIENGGYAGNITLRQLKIIYKNFGIPCCLMVDEHPEYIEEIYILHTYGNEARLQFLINKK